MALLSTHTRPSLLTPHPSRRGITLVEMLISMAVTLLMMAAVVNLFANVGEGVRNRRASMELGSELRLARARLFKDLAGVTCPVRPKLPSDDHDDGYFEIIEGSRSDENPSSLIDGDPSNGELDYATSLVPSGGDPRIVIDTTPGNGVRTPNSNDITNGGGLGDYDDILAMTVRSESEPFVGKCWVLRNGGTPGVAADYFQQSIESDLAEVIWFAVENPGDGSLGEPGMRTVYRRVLLIAPWLEGRFQLPTNSDDRIALLDFYASNDISVHRSTDASNVYVPNTLSDLTLRQNRFGHFVDVNGNLGFPYAMLQNAMRLQTYDANNPPTPGFGPLRPFGESFSANPDWQERAGEDVMLNDVLAFDLRVYDPGAPLSEYPVGSGIVIEPSSAPFYQAAVRGSAPVGYGAYVDLGWDDTYDYPDLANGRLANAPQTPFQEEHTVGWHPRVPNNLRVNPSVYDTWPYSYEDDGIDQDGDGVDLNGDGILDQNLDEASDGLDSDGVNGVDDPNERETAPPYDVPLRSMQVKIRVYERDTRQIREATVTKNFVPQ